MEVCVDYTGRYGVGKSMDLNGTALFSTQVCWLKSTEKWQYGYEVLAGIEGEASSDQKQQYGYRAPAGFEDGAEK